MANTIIINFGLSDRLQEYIKATYPTTRIIERSDRHLTVDVTALNATQQTNMLNDLKNRLVEQV